MDHKLSNTKAMVIEVMEPRILPNEYFNAQLTSCCHLVKTREVVLRKLSRVQLGMFRQTIFEPILDCTLSLNGQLSHHLLLREVGDDRPNMINFNLLGNIVSFGKEEFDLITGFKVRRATYVGLGTRVRLEGCISMTPIGGNK